MRAVLVDDEYYALQNLKIKLSEINTVEVVALYESGAACLEEIERIRPDVVFLDIEMPELDGFTFLERLTDTGQMPHIIFMTAYSHYAVKAFEYHATDYLVKPVSIERLTKALERLTPYVPVIESQQTPQKDAPLDIRSEDLVITCFRSFSIRAGTVEFNSGWKTKKAEELIAYLICEKGRLVSKVKIAEDLWPEVDGSKSMASLHVAFHHVKMQEKVRRIKLPIESLRGQMRFAVESTQCDLVRFDTLWETAFSPSTSLDVQVSLLEQAADLYTGHLFEDKFYSWASFLQQRCAHRYEMLLQFLIDYFQKNTIEDKAKCYRIRLEQMNV